MSQVESITPGGAKLRALRERAGKTQLWVELEAELGTGYLQRVESGWVRQPGYATLERILDALGARYSERREVLEPFGYLVPVPIPDASDIAWARDVSRRELHEFPFPAYVLDCVPRLIAWNQRVPRLFGLEPADPTLGGLAGKSLPAAWFDPASPIGPLVADPDGMLPALIRAFRHEMHQFQSEQWFQEELARLLELTLFRHYWEVVEREEQPPASAARALAPLWLDVPGAGKLQFRLSAEPFTRDARFRLVNYFPADARTMEVCASWTAGASAPRSIARTLDGE
jgi:transcriptional regulator with XRE-family HTH domain